MVVGVVGVSPVESQSGAGSAAINAAAGVGAAGRAALPVAEAPPAEPVKGNPDIAWGWDQARKEIAATQKALNRHGANLVVDGVLGPATKSAVREFQRSVGLVVDGNVGPATREQLSFRPTLREGDTGIDVEQVQLALNHFRWKAGLNGVDRLAVDGHYGPNTVEMVKVIQDIGGLYPDGKYGRETKRVVINWQQYQATDDRDPVYEEDKRRQAELESHEPVIVVPAGPGKQRIFLDRQASAAFIVGRPLASDAAAADALEAWAGAASNSGISIGMGRWFLTSYTGGDKWRIAGNNYYQDGKCVVLVTDVEETDSIHAWDIDRIGWHLDDHNCKTGPEGPRLCLTTAAAHQAGTGCSGSNKDNLALAG